MGMKIMGSVINTLMKLMEFTHKLWEGGNIFKSPQGHPLTKKIKKTDIVPTLKLLEPALGIPLVKNLLGSAGKKPESGDIDISVDPEKISKDELIHKLKQWVQHVHQMDGSDWVKKSGISVHFKMPIRNDPSKGYVQMDFMFHQGGESETDWMKFSMYSAGDSSAYTGADRNLLMSSLAKSQGLKYSWQKGLIHRDSEQLITKDPDQIAQRLLGPGHDHTSLLSVETIQSVLDENPELRTKLLNLAQALEAAQDAQGQAIKPGQLRQNQEEADRIKRLINS